MTLEVHTLNRLLWDYLKEKCDTIDTCLSIQKIINLFKINFLWFHMLQCIHRILIFFYILLVKIMEPPHLENIYPVFFFLHFAANKVTDQT